MISFEIDLKLTSKAKFSHFKFSSNKRLIKDYLLRKKGVTFTGSLCDAAKKYLFNITSSNLN